MGIAAAFMVPHPPLIVPQVGKGSEKQVETTIRSYEKVADEIAEIAPETIIVSSPHATMYGDYFHISPGKSAFGSFSGFRAPEVSFDEEYDSELVSEIERLAKANGFSAGTLGERDPALDHGTMVPLYFIRQKYKGGKIVRVGLSGLPLTDHYILGKIIQKAIDITGRKTVFVASGDLSHKLQDYGPYGFAKEGPEYDNRIMDVCSRGAFGEMFDFDESFCDKAAECGHRSFVIMAGAFDGYETEAKQFSHEDVTGVGYGICSFYPKKNDAGEIILSEDRKFLEKYMDELDRRLNEKREKSDAYVRLAISTIETYIRTGHVIDIPDDTPAELKEKRAGAFVSIHKLGSLRGCIGTILPTTECVAQEIINNAVSASTRDPRFDAITTDELQFLEINVDVLGDPEDISSPDELDVKRYGVIVTKGRKRGLLLPDLDGVDTVEEQLSIAKRKAGIDPDDEDVELQRFEVVRHY